MRGGYVIRDANKYELYVLTDGTQERHPVYQILLNNEPKAVVRCRSKFLEPRMELEFGGKIIVFRAAEPNNQRYTILCKENEIGRLDVLPQPKGEYKFEMRVEETQFEDFLPLVPLATVECIAPKTIAG